MLSVNNVKASYLLQSFTMRVLTLHGLGLILALSTPALSQVQQNDPNAANASFARQSEMRALQQNNVSNYNNLNMQIQRNAQFSTNQSYAYPVIGRYRNSAPHQINGRSHSTTGHSFNSSVCIGC